MQKEGETGREGQLHVLTWFTPPQAKRRISSERFTLCSVLSAGMVVLRWILNVVLNRPVSTCKMDIHVPHSTVVLCIQEWPWFASITRVLKEIHFQFVVYYTSSKFSA